MKVLKATMAQDALHLEKQELLDLVQKQADKIRRLESRKKYGLVWEDKPEDVVVQCQTELPVLTHITKCEITGDTESPTNILIEGDNYHALSVLNYTHQKKIDIIYIDPPYNTGAKSWKYNNDYVDKNDAWRHSKWLSFMRNRLALAKNLLKDEGSLICAVDENEHATLGLLLEEFFPSKEIVCVTIVHNPGGIQGKNFSYCHEYAYFVFPAEGTRISTVARGGETPTPLRDWGGEESKRETAKNCFYPIFVKDGKILGFGDVARDGVHPSKANVIKKDGTVEVYPIDSSGIERKWRFARQSIDSIADELAAELVRGEWTIRRYKKNYRWKTVWTDDKYNANVYGTQLLGQIIKTKFPYPKSLYTVEDCIKAIIHDKESAIILDFFAGSGTTGHAVLELNRQDGGKRSFILCTNNEGEICDGVCYPRISNVIQGYKNQKTGEKVPGLGGNLRYFTTSFIKKSASKDNTKMHMAQACTEMLCLREGIYDEIKRAADYRIFKQGDRLLAVYYSLEREALPALKKELDKLRGHKVLYCFTLDPLGLDAEDFDGWNDIRLEPIPQKILDVYEEIYEHQS